MAQRLTRREQQARTRSSLMRSAARVFARRGLHRASIEEVAGDAGFTKGAFYANFRSKEDLFLAMLDERFAARLAEIDRAVDSQGDPRDQALRAGADFSREIAADPDWQRLFFEFAVHAAREPQFRAELVARYRGLRDRVAQVYERRAGELGIDSPIPLRDISTMTFAMANGMALEKLLEPDAVADELPGTMFMIFFAGLAALAGVPPRDR
jgi:AcrR family transcriptional regulator